MQDHGIPEQKQVNKLLVELSRKLEIGLVATNDLHYIDKKDAEGMKQYLKKIRKNIQ